MRASMKDISSISTHWVASIRRRLLIFLDTHDLNHHYVLGIHYCLDLFESFQVYSFLDFVLTKWNHHFKGIVVLILSRLFLILRYFCHRRRF